MLSEQLVAALVAQIDRNSPRWQEDISAFAEIGPRVAVPHLVHAMWGPKRDSNWGYDVESICWLLKELPDPAFAEGCGPTVAHLLALHHDPVQLDPSFLADVLEKVGPSSTAYAIPALIDLLGRGHLIEVEEQVLRILASYGEDALHPYKLLLDNVRRG